MPICKYCGFGFLRPSDKGPEPAYCSPAHRHGAYIKRLKMELAEYRRLYGPLDESIKKIKRGVGRLK